MREIVINSDPSDLSATVYDSKETHAVLVIASATGVKQSYYKKFASFMSTQGITVITFDYSGIGGSLRQPIKKLTTNAADWGKKDLESVLSYATTNYPAHKKNLLGHSIGGQLIGLSPSATELDKIVLVAAQSGYWRLWKGFARVKMWTNWHILFPSLLSVFGYLPSKRISGMEDLPKNVARQWSNWGKNRDYLLGEISLVDTVFDKIATEMTAISIDDDAFAPRTAVDWMSEKYSKAPMKRLHLLPKDYNVQEIGHFGVFKEQFKGSLWPLLLNEMNHNK